MKKQKEQLEKRTMNTKYKRRTATYVKIINRTFFLNTINKSDEKIKSGQRSARERTESGQRADRERTESGQRKVKNIYKFSR
jgi:hypothetical protein